MPWANLIAWVVAVVASASTALAVESETLRDDFQIALDAALAGNFEAAFSAWLPLAENGDREAQYNIGTMYRRGNFVDQDDVAAAQWFRLAAEQGLPIAQCQMGYMYANGLGLSRDLLKGAQWTGLAAASGSLDGEKLLAAIATELGWIYMTSDESPGNDPVLSCMWFMIGAENGDEHAAAQADLVCGALEILGMTGGLEARKARCVDSGYLDCE